MTVPIHSRPQLAAVIAVLAAADLPSSDLTDDRMEHFFYCGSADAPVAIVGMELCGRCALLRSLVVAPGQRRTGLGTALVEHAERHALTHGAGSVYLLTTTAEAFFARRGYVRTDRDSAPPEIRASRQFADICPDSAVLMLKRLGRRDS